MNHRRLREREAFAQGQLLGMVPLGAIAGGLLAPVVSRFLAGWLHALPVLFRWPGWLAWPDLGRFLAEVPWPSVTTQGAIVGVLVPLVIFFARSRELLLDDRAASQSRLPTVGPGGSLVIRTARRASYARGTARKGR